jgi:hypothetical protein
MMAPIYVKRELHVTSVRLGHNTSHLVELLALVTSGQGGALGKINQGQKGEKTLEQKKCIVADALVRQYP